MMHAFVRSAALVHEEMKEGLDGLASIASIAPLLGLLGTVIGIADSFAGCGGERSACMAAVFYRLSGSMWFTALGLLVGLTSLWGHRYLTARLGAVDLDIRSASLHLINQLARYRGEWRLARTTKPSQSMFGAKSPAELRQDQKFWICSMFLTGAALLGAWCVQVVRYAGEDYLPLGPATWAACLYVLFVFGASCISACFTGFGSHKHHETIDKMTGTVVVRRNLCGW